MDGGYQMVRSLKEEAETSFLSGSCMRNKRISGINNAL
jgi:hypothetical protein